jgi:2,3-bisphosphoglycerate-independent phosphoglycerate mutase
LTKAFVLDDFDAFPTHTIDNLDYVCFTEYYDGVARSQRANVTIAFPPIELTNLFGDFVSKQGLRQLRIAETEKFAHVTFFFNGQSDVVFENEERILVPSPDVATYDLQPEMSAYEVKAKALDAIASDRYDVIVLNFANPDMVGHTGDFKAAKQACEVVDACVGEVVDAILKKDGVALLTADHGNAEQMIDYVTGKPMTAHTSHLVWAHLISNRADLQKQVLRLKPCGGKLADLIPTLIEVMGLEKTTDMEGRSLIEKSYSSS